MRASPGGHEPGKILLRFSHSVNVSNAVTSGGTKAGTMADMDRTLQLPIQTKAIAHRAVRHTRIGIGGRLTTPPLAHHLAYVSRTSAVRSG
jgi:hypothetical protein